MEDQIKWILLWKDSREIKSNEDLLKLKNLHNEIFPNIYESNVGCSSCRSRVLSRLKRWANEQR